MFHATRVYLAMMRRHHISPTGLQPSSHGRYVCTFDQVSLEKSAEASEELDRQRDVYRDFARAGSTLFFLVEAMQVVAPKYSHATEKALAKTNVGGVWGAALLPCSTSPKITTHWRCSLKHRPLFGVIC